MSVRRPHTTSPSNTLLQSSTSGWYAEWKARKQAAVVAEPGQEAPSADDAAEALANWLTGGHQK